MGHEAGRKGSSVHFDITNERPTKRGKRGVLFVLRRGMGRKGFTWKGRDRVTSIRAAKKGREFKAVRPLSEKLKEGRKGKRALKQG